MDLRWMCLARGMSRAGRGSTHWSAARVREDARTAAGYGNREVEPTPRQSLRAGDEKRAVVPRERHCARRLPRRKQVILLQYDGVDVGRRVHGRSPASRGRGEVRRLRARHEAGSYLSGVEGQPGRKAGSRPARPTRARATAPEAAHENDVTCRSLSHGMY